MYCALIISGDALSNVFTTDPIRIVVGILLALIIGGLCGALNGFFVGKFNLAPILVTVATNQLFYGISIILKKGGSVTGAPDNFIAFGADSLFNIIPYVFVLSLVCYILVAIFINKTSLGEEIKLHGSNRIANLYSGCNNVRTVMISYIASGLLSAVAGIVVYSKMGVARPDYGTSFLNMTLLIVLLSGASMAGGFGKVASLFVASLSVQVISSGLTLGGFSPYFRQVSWGVLLLIVIVINTEVFSRWIRALRSRLKVKKSEA
ncbi:MAG: ABC transporter permease [Clostridiaceae bacterium]|nr:ABC transporter permease [Clostridiaceae bacterium]